MSWTFSSLLGALALALVNRQAHAPARLSLVVVAVALSVAPRKSLIEAADVQVSIGIAIHAFAHFAVLRFAVLVWLRVLVRLRVLHRNKAPPYIATNEPPIVCSQEIALKAQRHRVKGKRGKEGKREREREGKRKRERGREREREREEQ